MSELTDLYLAQSAVNATALTAFATRYPAITVGATFTDTNGNSWEFSHIGANRGFVYVYAKYIDGMTVTDYEANINEIMYRNGVFYFTLSFITTGATDYTETDLIGGTIMQITIEGGPALNPATDYTFNDIAGKISFLIPIIPDQQVDVNYKKSPYIA